MGLKLLLKKERGDYACYLGHPIFKLFNRKPNESRFCIDKPDPCVHGRPCQNQGIGVNRGVAGDKACICLLLWGVLRILDSASCLMGRVSYQVSASIPGFFSGSSSFSPSSKPNTLKSISICELTVPS